MNYYKVIADGAVIDANCVFLKFQQKNGILVGCKAEEAQFIQSSDQEKVWRAPWLNPAPEGAGDYEMVDAVEITEEEYLSIRQQLDDGGTVVEPDEDPEVPTPEPPEEGQPEGETVMSVAEMRRIIAQQSEQLQAQAEHLEFLEGCLLEMSEIVYDV